MPDIETLLAKTRRYKDCRLWKQAKNGAGYPVVAVGRKTMVAHRIILEERDGPAPEGYAAYRTCGRRHCLNPDHLSWQPKGRVHVESYKSGNRKLVTKIKQKDVMPIRDRLRAGESPSALAKEFGVSYPTIRAIKVNRTWTHLHDEPPLPSKQHRPANLNIHELAEWILEQCKPNDAGCLEWQMSKFPAGYGHTVYQGENTYPHLVVAISKHGPKPPDKHCVTIACGNKSCCNPDHLLWTTYAESCQFRDGRKKGQHLCASDIPGIRNRLENGESIKSLAEEYRCSISTIYSIQSGRTWKWVENPVDKTPGVV